jgi:hypothetical protein
MANLDEPNGASGTGDESNKPPEKMSRLALEARVRELEKENAALRLDIQALNIHVKRDAELLHALMLEGIPLDKVEMAEAEANHKSISELLAEAGYREEPK